MKFLRTISKISPYVKTLGGLKRIYRGSGVVMPKLYKMHITNTPSIPMGGKIVGVKKQQLKPLKFLL